MRNNKKIRTNFVNLFEKGYIAEDMVLEAGDILFIPDNFSRKISIVGAVNQPKTVPYRDDLTILDVILSAGGFTEFAKENDVKIIRQGEEGKKSEIRVKAKDLLRKGNMEENILLEPGDVIIVKETIF